MSIPLDRLYDYVETVANKVFGDVVIYRFSPHGSKNLEDLQNLHDWDYATIRTLPPIICHDQEPLDYNRYQKYQWSTPLIKMLIDYQCYQPLNLEKPSIFDQAVLLHSEKQSLEVEKYCSDGRFVPVFYWSHALIARDWFRYAQHVNVKKTNPTKLFLCYNRAWSGTREYRIKFVQLLLENCLDSHCLSRFNCVDPDIHMHYRQYNFHNPVWKPSIDLEGTFPPNTYNSNSSADFEIVDYESTHIEVVLETLFDDTRLHLTEKTLRPIACGQPFIICAASGTLSYLKYYGFKTFDEIWDESYDQISDPVLRLEAVVELMKQITAWDFQTKSKKFVMANAIAEHNKKHFFSKEFFDRINSELHNNLRDALLEQENANTSSRFINFRKTVCKHPELKNIFVGKQINPNVQHLPNTSHMKETIFKPAELIKVLTKARKYYHRHGMPAK